MAASQKNVSFDQIIKADRQKRKNEDLANKILGKNRRASAPGAGTGNKAHNATPKSLASRIGVTKRSASATFKPSKATRVPTAPARSVISHPKAANKRRPDENRLMSALNPGSGQANVRSGAAGLSIKGASSGPFVVLGSNFAPGTTAADIQSAVEPVTGQILNCWITSQHPAVTAEISFAEKSAAEGAIANFHNQRADGRVISMQMRQPGTRSRRDLFDSNVQPQSPFNNLREQADRERRLQRGVEPTAQGGNHGLGGSSQGSRRNNQRGNRNRNTGGSSNQQETEQGLYSDQMMTDAPAQNSRNRKWGR
ncbi:hypothetical protein FE257_011207 [Aspergillus nanangensis]|uniref:RRM domain-containing protein n=1 Tax=Aspergillus nanangensis TaxID=2582783 RepID=A0AAD4GSS5_ASPNN|nr:hypothetical protein FE257_011207 [Aspergillus nanangensis]